MNQRVGITLSVIMPDDPDQQNALALSVLGHLARVASRFGVDLADGEVYAMINDVSDLETPEDEGDGQ